MSGMKLTARQSEIWDLHKQGLSHRQIADRLGVSHSVSVRTCQAARKKLEADPSEGLRAALADTRLDGLEASHGWIKTDGASVFFKNSALQVAGEDAETALEEMAQIFERIPAAAPAPAPSWTSDDMLNVIPIPDAHVGMHSWRRETGEDYDLKKATERVVGTVADLVHSMPSADTTLLLNLGDFTHADDDTSQTPTSKHNLDTDGRHYKVLDAAIEIIAASIDAALRVSRRVVYRGLPGNHDPHTARAVTLALAQRYREEPRAEIIKDPSSHFFFEWGNVLIGAHHGDGVKPERLVLNMADACDFWRGGRGQFRHLYTGHLHHLKSADIGGVLWEQLRAVCPKDAYAAKHAYSARASMIGVTFDKNAGEINRVSRHF